MSTTSIAPEVARFAAAVRARLADLTDDEREELVGGLEADLSDLVAERGTEALGDPDVYARELRSAAGLEPAMGRVAARRPVGETLDGWLDAARERWHRAVTGLPGAPWDVVVSLRPVWWLLRAYVAVQLLDLVGGNSYTMAVVPTLSGFEIPLLLVAVVASVQVGRGRLWPGGRRGVTARLVLLGLNLLALAVTPVVASHLPTGASWESINGYYADDASTPGLSSDGNGVTNVYPYDAEGRPLTGVQLFDQDGRPLAVDPTMMGAVGWAYPWTNVNGELWNTFPMPESDYDTGSYCCDRMPSPWTSDTPPTFLRPPLDQVPPVTIPDAAYGADGPPAEEATAAREEEVPTTGAQEKKERRQRQR